MHYFRIAIYVFYLSIFYADKMEKHRKVWEVEVIIPAGARERRSVASAWMLTLDPGMRVIIPFENKLPSGTNPVGLFGQFLGKFAKDHNILPLHYDGWPYVCGTQKAVALAAVMVSSSL